MAEGELQGDNSVEQAAEEAESETADLKRFCEVDVWTVSSSVQFCALLSKRKTYALREKSELVRYTLTLCLSVLSIHWLPQKMILMRICLCTLSDSSYSHSHTHYHLYLLFDVINESQDLKTCSHADSLILSLLLFVCLTLSVCGSLSLFLCCVLLPLFPFVLPGFALSSAPLCVAIRHTKTPDSKHCFPCHPSDSTHLFTKPSALYP